MAGGKLKKSVSVPNMSGKSVKARRNLYRESVALATKNLSVVAFREDQDELSKFLINPYSPGYRCWWYITTLCSFITAFFTPWEIAFQESPGLKPYTDGPALVEYFLSFIFLIDIVVSFFVPYIRPNGLVEKRGSWVMMHYMRTWLIVDVMGILPLSTILAEGTDKTNGSYIRGFALLRLLRLVRVRRIFRFFREFETNMHFPLVITTLFRNLAIVVLVGHFAGCMFYFISRWYEFDEDTWLGATVEDLESKTELEKYIITFYYSITTMTTVGYGDFSPKNTAEIVFGTIYMIFNILLNSYILGTITLVVIKADEQIGTLRSLYDKLNSFAFLNNLNEPCRKMLKEHVRFTFMNSTLQDQDLLDALPTGIRRSLQRNLYFSVLSHLNIFRLSKAQESNGAFNGFMMMLVEKSKVDVYIPDQIIINKGDILHELHVMMAGVAHVYTEDNDKEPKSQILEHTDFGSDSFFTKQEVTYQIRSRTICRVLIVTREVYDEACASFPSMAKSIEKSLLSHRIPTNPSVTSLNSFGAPTHNSGSDSEENAPAGVLQENNHDQIQRHPPNHTVTSPFEDTLQGRLSGNSRTSSTMYPPTPPLPTIMSED